MAPQMAAVTFGEISGSHLGLTLADDAPFEVHSVRPTRRVSPDGTTLTDVIAVITQSRDEP